MRGTTCEGRHAIQHPTIYLKLTAHPTHCFNFDLATYCYLLLPIAANCRRRYERDDINNMQGTTQWDYLPFTTCEGLLAINDMRGTTYEGQAMKRHAIDGMQGTACEGQHNATYNLRHARDWGRHAKDGMRGAECKRLNARDGMRGTECEEGHTTDGVRGTTTCQGKA